MIIYNRAVIYLDSINKNKKYYQRKKIKEYAKYRGIKITDFDIDFLPFLDELKVSNLYKILYCSSNGQIKIENVIFYYITDFSTNSEDDDYFSLFDYAQQHEIKLHSASSKCQVTKDNLIEVMIKEKESRQISNKIKYAYRLKN
jgi:hypothetical protein